MKYGIPSRGLFPACGKRFIHPDPAQSALLKLTNSLGTDRTVFSAPAISVTPPKSVPQTMSTTSQKAGVTPLRGAVSNNFQEVI